MKRTPADPVACADLVRRRNNLEDGIRRDRIEIRRLNPRMRQIEIEVADLQALNHDPDPAIPNIDQDRDKKRPSTNLPQWAIDQMREIIEARRRQRETSRRIATLVRRLDDLRGMRDQSQRLLNDSVAGKAQLVEHMRRFGCPAAGTTNY